MTQTLGIMKGKSWVTYREEWPRIREQLDQGKLATVGLVQADNFNIGDNHQVLAYAYEQSGQLVTLWIYDPNIPGGDDVRLQFDITNTADGITVTRVNGTSPKKIFAILHMDNYSPRRAPAGRALLPAGRAKVFELFEADADSSTTGGTATTETRNKCGGLKRIGTWTCSSRITYGTNVSGFMEPALAWRIGGDTVPLTSGSMTVSLGGHTYTIDVVVYPGGRTLTVNSRSGDTYKIPVSVELRDALGEFRHATVDFEVDGHYEGIRIEDIRAEGRCLASLIPVPVDIYTIPLPGEWPDPRMSLNEWRRVTLERLNRDPGLDEHARAEIVAYVNAQARSPELRMHRPLRVNRASLRFRDR